MDLHDLIAEAQDFISEAIIAEQAGDLKEAYDYMDGLNDLLIEKLVPMKRPE